MTIREFNYEAMVAKEPTTWQERGLHWHCYSWTGSGADYANDSLRNDNSAAVAPLVVREWLNKPRSMLLHIAHTPDDALKWLKREHAPLIDRILYPEQQVHTDWSFTYRLALYDLRCGGDLVRTEWIKGPRITYLAVIGTAENCHTA